MARASVSGVVPMGASLSSLEIGLQAIQLWPYHAGLAARRRGRLQAAAAFLACSCLLALSRPDKPVTQEPSSSSSRLRRGYDEAPRGAHRTFGFPEYGSPTVFMWSLSHCGCSGPSRRG